MVPQEHFALQGLTVPRYVANSLTRSELDDLTGNMFHGMIVSSALLAMLAHVPLAAGR
jgi:hypothetical protein